MLQKLGRLDEAEASLTQAIALELDYAEAHLNLGYVRQDKGDLEAAIASFKQAINIEPDYAKAFYNKALSQEIGWLEEAEMSLSLQDFEVGWPLYE